MDNQITPVSPFSTGHGGASFEILVATHYVVSMLADEIPVGARGPVQSVGFQQRNRGFPVDDIVVRTTGGTLALQVKHRITFSDNENFREVITGCWKHFESSTFNRSRDRIAIAISSSSNINKVRTHLYDFLEWARTSENADSFHEKVQNFKVKKSYLEIFTGILRDVAAADVSRDIVWSFLKILNIIPFDFDISTSRYFYKCWNDSRVLVRNRDEGEAESLMRLLFEIIARFEKTGGEITTGNVRTELPSTIHLRLPSEVRAERHDIKNRLRASVENQLAREKTSKKYIPDVCMEIGSLKDQARRLSHPTLFLPKTVKAIRQVDFTVVNRFLRRLSLDPVGIDLDAEYSPSLDLQDIGVECAHLIEVVEKARQELEPIAEGHHAEGIQDRVPKKKIKLFKEIRYYLGSTAASRLNQLNDLIGELRVLRGGALLIVDSAAKGKTNFVCNFAEKFILAHSLPCIYLTGSDLNNADLGRLGEHILKAVSGDSQDDGFGAVMVKLEQLCLSENSPLTIIIDGLNEHHDLSRFSDALEQLLNSLSPHIFVRFILTCRSEYFEHRFSNLSNSAFADRICILDRMHSRMSDKHKQRMRKAYFAFFNISCPGMRPRAEEILENNPFLLRIFCETHGDHESSTTKILPPQWDIYKDSLFRAYLDKKLEWLEAREVQASGINVGARSRYRRCLRNIIALMVERRQFSDIPVSEVDERDYPALNEMLNESVLVRKDLRQNPSVLNDAEEVLNITFDEFRDFLLVDHLVSDVFSDDREKFQELIEVMIQPSSPAAEGVSNFLFYKSRKRSEPDLLNMIAEKSWYEAIFIDCIFSMEDQYVNEGDISEIKARFLDDARSAARIACDLIPRYNTEAYSNLNIATLFEILDDLDDDLYNALVIPIFDTSSERYGRGPLGWGIEWLCNRLIDLCSDNAVLNYPHRERLLELLIYLFEIPGQEYSHPALETFHILLGHNSSTAYRLLSKHLDVNVSGIARRVWRFLIDLVESGEEPPKDLKESALRLSNEPGKGEGWRTLTKEAATEFLQATEAPNRRVLSGYLGGFVGMRTNESPEDKRIWFVDDHTFILLYKPDWELELFIEVAHVSQGSHGNELATRIFECLFNNLTDLRKDYEEYYSAEYTDFLRFLYFQCDLDEDDLKALGPELTESWEIGIGSVYAGGDYVLGQFIMSELGMNCVSNALAMLEGGKDED